jgi:hypothetical protein
MHSSYQSNNSSRRRCRFNMNDNSNDNISFNGRYYSSSSALQSTSNRREVFNIALQRTFVMATTTATIITTSNLLFPLPKAANAALDYDAFESSIINQDTTKYQPKLNNDEALCKYGAPGKAMGEACARANIQRTLPGGVDVTGKVNRGEYLKCRYEYPIDASTGEYVKTRVCRPSSETTYD